MGDFSLSFDNQILLDNIKISAVSIFFSCFYLGSVWTRILLFSVLVFICTSCLKVSMPYLDSTHFRGVARRVLSVGARGPPALGGK